MKKEKQPERCPHCSRHCPLSDPHCSKGKNFAKSIAKKQEKAAIKADSEKIDSKEIPLRKQIFVMDSNDRLQQLLCTSAGATCMKPKNMVLIALLRQGEMNLSQLTLALKTSVREMKELIHKMERKQLVISVRSTTEPERQILLTERGIQKAGKLHVAYNELLKEYFSPLREDEHQILEDLLQKLSAGNKSKITQEEEKIE